MCGSDDCLVKKMHMIHDVGWHERISIRAGGRGAAIWTL